MFSEVHGNKVFRRRRVGWFLHSWEASFLFLHLWWAFAALAVSAARRAHVSPRPRAPMIRVGRPGRANNSPFGDDLAGVRLRTSLFRSGWPKDSNRFALTVPVALRGGAQVRGDTCQL